MTAENLNRDELSKAIGETRKSFATDNPTVPYIEGIRLKLVIKLTDEEIERIPKKNQTNLFGLKFPKLEINGKNSSSVAKVKVKLNEINE